VKQRLVWLAVIISVSGVLPGFADAPDPQDPTETWQAVVPGRARFVLRSQRSFARNLYPLGRVVLETRAFPMHIGDRRLVEGRLTARNIAKRPEEQQIQIGCAPVGAPPETMVYTSRNHIGPSSLRGTGKLSIDATYLYVAAQEGLHRCTLLARSSGNHLTALPYETSMSVSRSEEVQAEQWSLNTCGSRGGYVTPDEVPVRVSSGCAYLVPGGRGGFPETATPLRSDRFIAASGAQGIEVIGGLQVTTCYVGTGSCVPEVSRFGGPNPRSNAIVETRLDVVQLDALGAPCATSSSHPETEASRTVITAPAHHQKITHRVMHRISTAAGCTRRFLLRMSVRAAEGNPLKITEVVSLSPERLTVPDGLPGRTMSNMIVRHLF
jgi:hypothetical protein